MLTDGPIPIDALQEVLSYWVRFFDRTRVRNKLLATITRIFIVVLSGLITIILAIDLSGLFQPPSSQYFKLAAIICSAIGVSLATFEAFIDHKRMWVQCGVALARTTLLQQRLSVAANSGQISKAEAESILQELNKIVGAYSKDWADSRSRSPDVLNQENFGQKIPSTRRRKPK